MASCGSLALLHHRVHRKPTLPHHFPRPLRRRITQHKPFKNTQLFCTAPDSPNTTTDLLELDAKTYYTYINEQAGDDLVVVDFYTDWCGPCKLMYPELLIMQKDYAEKGVRFVKFNCNKENKEIGKALNIRVAPTFFLYKSKQKVAEMRGAKLDELRSLVEDFA